MNRATFADIVTGKKTLEGFIPPPNYKAKKLAKFYRDSFTPTPERVLDAGIISPALHEMLVLSREYMTKIVDIILSMLPEYEQAIKTGNPQRLKKLLARGFPADYIDPISGDSIIHKLAAGDARRAIQVLLATNECTLLVTDKAKNLPSDIAYLHAKDYALARYLCYLEKKEYLNTEKIPLDLSARKWMK